MSAQEGGGFVQAMQTLNLLTQLQNLAKSEEGQQLSKALADMYNSECDVLHIDKCDVFDQLGMTGTKVAEAEPGVTTPTGNEPSSVVEKTGDDPQKVEGEQEKKKTIESFQGAVLQSLLGQGGPQFGSQDFDALIKGMFPDFDKVAGSLAQRMEDNEELKAKFEAVRQKAEQVMNNFQKGSEEFCNNIGSDPMTCFHYMSQMMQACPAQAQGLAETGDDVATGNAE